MSKNRFFFIMKEKLADQKKNAKDQTTLHFRVILIEWLIVEKKWEKKKLIFK